METNVTHNMSGTCDHLIFREKLRGGSLNPSLTHLKVRALQTTSPSSTGTKGAVTEIADDAEAGVW